MNIRFYNARILAPSEGHSFQVITGELWVKKDEIIYIGDGLDTERVFEKEIKIKCLEEDTTQAEIAEKAGTTGSYVSRLINKNDGIINKTFVRLLEELGYDVELTYVKKEA